MKRLLHIGHLGIERIYKKQCTYITLLATYERGTRKPDKQLTLANNSETNRVEKR